MDTEMYMDIFLVMDMNKNTKFPLSNFFFTKSRSAEALLSEFLIVRFFRTSEKFCSWVAAESGGIWRK
jgi:hypothetical protein